MSAANRPALAAIRAALSAAAVAGSAGAHRCAQPASACPRADVRSSPPSSSAAAGSCRPAPPPAKRSSPGANYHADRRRWRSCAVPPWDLFLAGLAVVSAAAAVGAACGPRRAACEERAESRFSAWKQHKTGRYENRLRFYSHPLKVFKYFSSVVLPDSDGQPVYFMTPQDFVRSLVPYNEVDSARHAQGGTTWSADVVISGADPVDRNPDADGDMKSGRDSVEASLESPELRRALDFFKLADTNGDGLIAYQEYLFFLAILSIPEHQFDIAFKIFDSNQNGDIDFAEFSRFLAVSKPPTLTQIGRLENGSPAAYRSASDDNTSATAAPCSGLEVRSPIPTAPTTTAASSTSVGVFHYLFGPNLDQKLSLDDFRRFLTEFRSHILALEFFGSGFDVDRRDSSISARNFASIVIGYADYRRIEEYAERCKALESVPERVTFAEFKVFNKIMNKIEDVALAMRLYSQAGMCDPKGFSPSDLSRAIKSATNTSLSGTQINVIYRIFDCNGDGYLNHEELLDVLKKRRSRGLDQPRDIGILRYIRHMLRCVADPMSSQ